MMQGRCTPLPPPHPMVSPPCLSSGWVVLFGLVPPPVEWGLWSFWLAPPCLLGGSLFYRSMVWLLPLVSSNVIVTCLLPSPRWGLWSFLVGPAPPVWGSVFYRGMVWLLPLVSSNVIATCSLPHKI